MTTRATGALLLCIALFAFSGTFGVLAADAKQSGSWSGGGIWVALALVVGAPTGARLVVAAVAGGRAMTPTTTTTKERR